MQEDETTPIKRESTVIDLTGVSADPPFECKILTGRDTVGA
jgi:hypothetical protein